MGASVSLGRFDGSQDDIVAATTAQATAALLTGAVNRVTTAAGQTAVRLPANAAQGSPIVAVVLTATAGALFPPVGGAINGLAANTSVAVAANKAAVCYPHQNGLDYTVAVGA